MERTGAQLSRLSKKGGKSENRQTVCQVRQMKLKILKFRSDSLSESILSEKV